MLPERSMRGNAVGYLAFAMLAAALAFSSVTSGLAALGRLLCIVFLGLATVNMLTAIFRRS